MVAGSTPNRVFVYLGRPTPSELRRIEGGSASARLGASVSGAGDVDADGYDDVIVGAPYDDTGAGADAGSASVLSGFDGRTLLACEGAAAGDALGFSVSAAGDVDRDGFDDVIVGAHLRNAQGLSDSGSAFVYSLGYPRDGPKRRRPRAPVGPTITFP